MLAGILIKMRGAETFDKPSVHKMLSQSDKSVKHDFAYDDKLEVQRDTNAKLIRASCYEHHVSRRAGVMLAEGCHMPCQKCLPLHQEY